MLKYFFSEKRCTSLEWKDSVLLVDDVFDMPYWAKVLAFRCEVVDFVCEFEDGPAEDTWVAAHDAVEGAKGVGTGVKVEGPVAVEGSAESGEEEGACALSDVLPGAVTLHALGEGLGAPGVDSADDAASVHDVEGGLADELADVLVGGDVGGDAEHFVEGHG